MTAPNAAHYAHAVEVIDAIEAWGLTERSHLANVVKYVARAHFKGTPRADLIKARDYLHRELTGTWPEPLEDTMHASNSDARKRHNPGTRIEGGDPGRVIPELRAEIERLTRAIRLLESALDERYSDADHTSASHWRRYREATVRAERAEAERDALAAKVERVRAARMEHPACDRHDDDDPVTCGWKSAVLSIDAALDGDA